LLPTSEVEQTSEFFYNGGMKITIEEISPDRLGEYANIPTAFMVKSIYQVELVDGGLGGISMLEMPVEHPYIKDYDLDESPEDWPKKFEVAKWGFFWRKQTINPLVQRQWRLIRRVYSCSKPAGTWQCCGISASARRPGGWGSHFSGTP
jgi:hypothetical protein